MAYLPGFSFVVQRNDSNIPATSASFNKQAGEAGGNWEITLADPTTILPTDTWTLRVGLGGASWPRFTDALAENIGGGDDSSPKVTRVVRGKLSTLYADLFDYCLPQTYVFINPDWAKATWGKVYVDAQGTLVTQSQKIAAGVQVVPGHRCWHTRLPGQEMEAGTFKCVLSCRTHHDVAKYLADLFGYDIYITTPDVAIRDTSTFSSGTVLFECIKKNFTFWNPDISVRQVGLDSIIYILDILSPSAAPASSQIINIGAKALQAITYSEEVLGKNKTDHLIVTGRAPLEVSFSGSNPDLTPIKIAEISTPINQVGTSELSFDDIKALKTMGEYSGEFGTGDDVYTVYHANKSFATFGYHAKYGQSGDEVRLPVLEIHYQVNSQGITTGKVVTFNTYGEGDRVIRTIEKEYNRTIVPGSSSPQLILVRVKTTDQSYFIESIGLALTSEIIEELVVYDSVEADNQTYKDNPNPFAGYKRLDKSRTVIESANTTQQRLLEMTTHYRMTYISRTDENTLKKMDFDYDVLSDTFRSNSQTLQNPKPIRKRDIKDKVYRKEFFREDGGKRIGELTCYRPPVTINHEDITNDTTAELLKDRVFNRNSEERNITLTLKCKTPLPTSEPGAAVKVGSFSVLMDGVSKTISGGSYFLRGFAESISMSNNGFNYDQTITVRTKY